MFSNLSTSASMWKKLNSILGKTSASSRTKTLKINGQELGGAELANKFNDYFINLVSNDRSRVNEALLYVSRFVNESIFFYPTDVHEVSSVFCNLNNSKSCDIDGIQIKPVKYVIAQIAPILTHLFNLSLSQGIFPQKMQIAKVSILYKSGDKNDLSNYRPVSVLPIFSKGLEKLIHFRLNQFCENFSVVTDSQFGFRKGRSTELALLNMKEIILKNFENKLLTVGIFIDFSKAFDRLNHDTLMRKLYNYGIRGNAAALIRSYLSIRFQCIHLNGHFSDLKQLQAGVPQGSVLGPILFNLYINDIINISHNAQIITYADDTSIFFQGTDINIISSEVNSFLNEFVGNGKFVKNQ